MKKNPNRLRPGIRGLDAMSPKEIVKALDRYDIGQQAAKKAVAIAVRNRIRRQKLDEKLGSTY